MVRKYKDIGRVGVKTPTNTNFTINVPNPIGANKLAESVSQSASQISNTLFNMSKIEAQKRGKEDASKSVMKMVDGVPEFEPTDLGGTIYNQAYNDAVKINYVNALDNSIEEKVTSVKNKYFNDPILRTNTDNLISLLDSELGPMRSQVSSEFLNQFDTIVSKRTNSVVQTDIKENANRARLNTINGTAESLKKTMSELYNLKGKEFEEGTRAVLKLNETLAQLNPELITKETTDALKNEMIAIGKWQELSILLASKDKDNNYILTTDNITQISDAINTFQDSVDIDGTTIDLKDIHNSAPAKDKIITKLTTIQNNRSKNDLSYLQTSSNILEESNKFNNALSDILDTASPAEIKTLKETTEKNLQKFANTGNDNKTNLQINNLINAQINQITRQANSVIIRKQKDNNNDIRINAKKNMIANLSNRDALLTTIENNKEYFKNDTSVGNLIEIVKDETKYNELTTFIDNINTVKNTGMLNQIDNIISGDQVLDEDSKLFGMSEIELFNKFSPVSTFITEHIQSKKANTSTLTEAMKMNMAITANMVSDETDSILVNNSTPKQRQLFFNQNILQNNTKEDLSNKAQLTARFLEKGYKTNAIGDIITLEMINGNNDFAMEFAVPLLREMEKKNIDHSIIGLSPENFGMLSYISRLGNADKEQINSTFLAIKEYTSNQGVKDQVQLNTMKTLGMDINQSSASDKERYNDMSSFLMAEVLRKGDAEASEITSLRQAVQYALNEHFMQYAATSKNLLNDKSDLIDRVDELVDKLETERVNISDISDYGASSTNVSDNPIYKNNLIKFNNRAHPYNNISKTFKKYNEYFDLKANNENPITAINIATQIKNAGGTFSTDAVPVTQVGWNTLVKNQSFIKTPIDIISKVDQVFTRSKLGKLNEQLNLKVIREATKIEPVAGDTLTGLTKSTNLIDLFSIKSIEGDVVPMTLGGTMMFTRDGTLKPNQRHVSLRFITSDGKTIHPIVGADNEPIVITLPDDKTNLIQNLESNLQLGIIKEKGTSQYYPAGRSFSDDLSRIGGLADSGTAPQSEFFSPNIDKLEQLAYDKKEDNIINLTRSQYTFRLINRNQTETEFTDTYIVKENNKYFLYPSTKIGENDQRKFEYQTLSKDDAVKEYKNTVYAIEYNTLQEAKDGKNYVENFKNKDKQIMNK